MEVYFSVIVLAIVCIIAIITAQQARKNQRSQNKNNKDYLPRRDKFESPFSFEHQNQFEIPKETIFVEEPVSDVPEGKESGDILSISVFATPHHPFASYDLLQAISSTGLQFGEMNIFHYYQRSPQGGRISLFSLASATKPGEFDLDRIGDFSCIGLIFFMDIRKVPNPLQAFYLMVSTAEQLAEDLDGELRANPKTPWSEAHFKACEKSIMEHQLTDTV